MSRKPVIEKSKETIIKALKNIGPNKRDWARALDVSTSAIEGWLKRGRIPKDIWDMITDKGLRSNKNTPMRNPLKKELNKYSDQDLIEELEGRHPSWRVILEVKRS